MIAANFADISITDLPEKVTAVASAEMPLLPAQPEATSGEPSSVPEMGIEEWDLSPDTADHIQNAKYQYSLAYMLLSAMNSPQDMAAFPDISPPDLTEEVPIVNRISPMMLETASSTPFYFTSSESSLSQRHPSERSLTQSVTVAPDSRFRNPSELIKFLDFFSPENISKRIQAVVASLFSASNLLKAQGNTRVARKAFVATVSKVVNHGLEVMGGQWENTPAHVRDEFDKTQALITAALQTFEESGSESERNISTESAAKLIADFFQDSAQRLEVLQQTFASASYNAHGRLHLLTTPTFSIKW